SSVNALIFRLAGLAVHHDVINLHVAVGAVIVGERDPDFAGLVGRGRVVLHAGRHRPGLDSGAAHLQADRFRTGDAAGAHGNAVCSAARGTGAAAGRTR